MADMIGIAASAAGGGVFGLVGTAIGRVAGYFERRQEHAHARERWVHEGELLKLEMAARAEAVEGEIALSESAGSWDGLNASLRAEASIGPSYPWVEAIRGLTRPTLTLLLWLIAATIFLASDAEGQKQITETATFAATAATLWWFGDRGPRREPRG